MSNTENLISKDKLNKKHKSSIHKDNTPLGLKTTNLKKISKIHPHVFMEVQLMSILIEKMLEKLFILFLMLKHGSCVQVRSKEASNISLNQMHRNGSGRSTKVNTEC